MLLKKLIAACAFGFAAVLSGQASAADIQFYPDEKLNIIVVKGQFEAGDEAKFAAIAVKAQKGLVFLDSPGGALLPALEIGKLIQIRGFGTFVTNDAKCVSACALVWAAGGKRFLAPTAQVGFHASYRDQDGKLEEVGVANALVGRYLTLLNLPERAVVFATSASPYEILWLSSVDANSVGMSFTNLDLDGPPTPPPVFAASAPPPPFTRTVPAQEKPASWYYAEESEGSKWYVRGKDVFAGTASSRQAEMWVKTDDRDNKSVARRSSMARFVINCVASTYTSDFYAEYDAEGNTLSSSKSTISGRLVPESVLESVSMLVCTDEHPGSDERDLP